MAQESAGSMVIEGGSKLTKIGAIAAGAGALLTAISFVETLDVGEMAVRKRFGRVRKDEHGNPDPKKVYGEGGLVFKVPFAHSIAKMSVQDREDPLPVVPLDLERLWDIQGGSVTWFVKPERLAVAYSVARIDTLDALKEKTINLTSWGLWAAASEVGDPDRLKDPRNAGEVFRLTRQFALEGISEETPGLDFYGVDLKLVTYKIAENEKARAGRETGASLGAALIDYSQSLSMSRNGQNGHHAELQVPGVHF